MLIAKFRNNVTKRMSYVPILGWQDNVALVPGEEYTEDAGTLFKVTESGHSYGTIRKLLFTGEEVEFDILDSRENDEDISEYYLYSDTILGDNRDGMLSE